MLDQFDSCDKENIVRQLVKVQAQVKVKPLVKHGKPKVNCIDSYIKPHSGHPNCKYDCRDCNSDYKYDCSDGTDHNCCFTLTQIICVEVPISFDVDVDINKGILCCGDPDAEPEPERIHDSKNDLNRQTFFLMNNKVQL